MLKKLYGAAAKAHAKKSARKGKSRPAAKKTTKKATSKGKTVLHKGYSYKSKSGKTVHVKAHREIRHK